MYDAAQEIQDMDGKIVVEIPHQRKATVEVWLGSHDAAELEERWNDLSAHHVFETWRDALQWAKNYRGHQALKVRAAVRKMACSETDIVCGDAEEGIGYLDDAAIELWKRDVIWAEKGAEWTAPSGEVYILEDEWEEA